jgi:hypothetical protein
VVGYAVVFVMSAGLMAANDFVNLSGAKLIPALILGGFVVALGIRVAAFVIRVAARRHR